jgi:hypothetical protein
MNSFVNLFIGSEGRKAKQKVTTPEMEASLIVMANYPR